MAIRAISATGLGRPAKNLEKKRADGFKDLFEDALHEYGATKAELATTTAKSVGVSVQWIRERCRRDRDTLDPDHARTMIRLLVAYRLGKEMRSGHPVPEAPSHEKLRQKFPAFSVPSVRRESIACIIPGDAVAPLADRLAGAITAAERTAGRRVRPGHERRYAASIRGELERSWRQMAARMREDHFVRAGGGEDADSLVDLLESLGVTDSVIRTPRKSGKHAKG